MLAKENRFRGRTSLGLVFRRGRTSRSAGLLIRFYPTSKTGFRAAVVVSRKVHKNAVVRNRIRRRIYEFISRHKSSIKNGDIVVTVLDTKLKSCSFEELDNILRTAFNQAHILS